ncbi:MAG: HlyC/CorC family transporter [Rhodospirillales bacterium]|nr:HlyC/CorC family transporter [Rhodospirillales bacterium]
MNSDILLAAGILLLLILSGFFSGTETALTASSRHRMHTLAQQGLRRAALVGNLWQDRERVIGTILIGNNLVNILASTLSASLFISWFGDAGIAYATLTMTVLVVIFAEILPKTYAINNADRTILAMAPVLRALVVVLTPATKALNAAVRRSLRIVGVSSIENAPDREEREEELRGAIDLHAGSQDREARAMLRSILDLADVQVSEIMTHRGDVVTIDADLPLAEIIGQVLDSPYTRIPLWQGNPDNIVGIIHAKRLLRALNKAEDDGQPLDAIAVASRPWFVPDTTDLLSQLQAFRQRHQHFAVVVDEYGVEQGIVTLEDILEEIVGDIADEHDEVIEGVKRQSDGSMVVDGRVTLRDLNRQFDWHLPDDDASTLAGLLIYQTRTIPEAGQSFAFEGLRFEVLQRIRNQIAEIKVTPLPREAGGDSPAAEATPSDGAA